jgi:PPOX class probable F420-dependent enzyme
MGILPDSGRAAERLDREDVGWVTTVSAGGQPQSSPVWFVVQDDAINLQSRPDASKVANVRSNRKVSFHFNSDPGGGDIVTIDGDAEVLDAPAPGVVDAYRAKYETAIREHLRSTPEAIIEEYRTPIRVTPRRVRTY